MKKLVLICAVLLVSVGWAFAQGPAVSGINGKVEGVLGNADGETAKVLGGSVTVPLGPSFGLQLDGALGNIDEDLYGMGFHLFTRDPEKYLLGITGLTADLDGFDVHRIGVEGEYYLQKFTIVGIAGQQFGDTDDNLHMNIDLRYYPIDNLMISTGGSLADKQQGKLHLGAEYQVVKGFAVYADLAMGENDYDHALFGVKYYFGQEKTLIKRHREDDPDNNIVYGLLSGYEKASRSASEDDYEVPEDTDETVIEVPVEEVIVIDGETDLT